MTRFYWECFKAGKEILNALAVGLDLEDEHYLVRKHLGHNNQLRLLHYPPIAAEEIEQERAARCPAHTDWSSMTMLFQDDCGGLEVKDVKRPGTFVAAKPVKHAIVMNVGDLLQRWSNGSSSPMAANSVNPGYNRDKLIYDRPSKVYKPSSHIATAFRPI